MWVFDELTTLVIYLIPIAAIVAILYLVYQVLT